jgi:hypothetical protein
MASIDISARIIGDTELAQTLGRLSSHDIPKAIEAGVRYASNSAKAIMASEMRRAGVVVPAQRLKDDIWVKRKKTTATVHSSSAPISAIRFKPRQTKKGLSITFYRGTKTIIRKGFMQRYLAQSQRGKMPFKQSTTHAYSGDISGDSKRNRPRKGLDFVYGLSVASMYLGGRNRFQMQQAVENKIQERLQTGILRKLRAIEAGYGAP